MGLFDKAPEGADVERLARDVHSALSELRNALENKSDRHRREHAVVPR